MEVTVYYKISDTEYIEGVSDNRFFLLHHAGEKCSFTIDLYCQGYVAYMDDEAPVGRQTSLVKNCDTCGRFIDLSFKYLNKIMDDLIVKHKALKAICQ